MDLKEKYLQMQVEQASRETLITMLYDGALRFLRQAKAHLTAAEEPAARESLGRVTPILTELRKSLHLDCEAAQGLDRLYEYMLGRLATADGELPAVIDEVAGLVQGLRDTWAQAARAAQQEAAAARLG